MNTNIQQIQNKILTNKKSISIALGGLTIGVVLGLAIGFCLMHGRGDMRGYNNGVRYGKHEMGRGMDRGGMMNRDSPQIIQVTASTTIK
jgi:hypothetical protein